MCLRFTHDRQQPDSQPRIQDIRLADVSGWFSKEQSLLNVLQAVGVILS